MAEGAGVDLSDALRNLQSAVIEAYPKSNAAKTFPKRSRRPRSRSRLP
jgi:hypothetical protein